MVGRRRQLESTAEVGTPSSLRALPARSQLRVHVPTVLGRESAAYVCLRGSGGIAGKGAAEQARPNVDLGAHYAEDRARDALSLVCWRGRRAKTWLSPIDADATHRLRTNERRRRCRRRLLVAPFSLYVRSRRSFPRVGDAAIFVYTGCTVAVARSVGADTIISLSASGSIPARLWSGLLCSELLRLHSCLACSLIRASIHIPTDRTTVRSIDRPKVKI